MAGSGFMFRGDLAERLLAALRLDLGLYRTVSTDPAAMSQAFRIVLLTGVSNGLSLATRLGVAGMLAAVVTAVLGWLLWAGVILITARLWGHRRGATSLLRPLGFANAPGLFLVLGLIPMVGTPIRVIIVVWLVATTARAVEATYAITRRRATVISVVGFVVYLALGVLSAHFAAS